MESSELPSGDGEQIQDTIEKASSEELKEGELETLDEEEQFELTEFDVK
jgi:hypothetical protein